MLHGTVWDTPSASSKKEVSFKPETELGYVTSNCVRTVRLCVNILANSLDLAKFSHVKILKC